MQIGDAASTRLLTRGALSLGEITLDYEVNDLVAERLRLPNFRTWSRRQFRSAGTRRGWSTRSEQLVLQLPAGAALGPVLLLQPRASDVWEAVCAHGRPVLVVEPDDALRERMLEHASESGWSELVRVVPSHEEANTDTLFSSVVYSPAACADLADWETDAMIESLKSRTAIGGLHVVDGLLAGRAAVPRTALRRGYASWKRRVQRGVGDWTLVAERPAAG